MKLPLSLKIAGYRYGVVYEAHRSRDRGTENPATCNSHVQTIWIDTDQHREGQESSLIHEIIEALDYHYELKLSHQTIATLETALYQVLKDNELAEQSGQNVPILADARRKE